MIICSLLAFAGAAQTPQLDLECSLDPAGAKMRVLATVACAPQTEKSDKVYFFLSDRMEEPKVRILEPARLAGYVKPIAKTNRNHDVTYEVALSAPLEAGQVLKWQFEYSNRDAAGTVFFLDRRSCFAGGYNTCWFPSVGSSRRMLGKMRFRTPAGFIVKASGKEEPAVEEGAERRSSFSIQQPTVPTFAAAPFKVYRVPGTLPMTLYLLKDRPIAKAYTEGCSRILAVLTKEFGPYPFPDFSIIETPSPESSRDLGFSGASFEGFMFADSDSIDSGFNLAYFGHEIGHQWWGNLVQTSGTQGSYMLSEALAQYGSLACVREIEGERLAERYRTVGYPDYSSRQCGRGAIMYHATEENLPLDSLPPGSDIVHHQYANAKGFLAWDSIARQIGRDKFRAALRSVTKKYAWQAVTFGQFLDEIRFSARSNVEPILSQWLSRKGAPVVSCSWVQSGDTVNVEVKQTAPLYALSMPLILEFEDGSRQVKELSLTAESTTFSCRTTRRVKSVQIDPGFEVFHSTPEMEAAAIALRDHTVGTFAVLRGQDSEALSTFEAGLRRMTLPDVHSVEFLLRTAIAGVHRRAGRLKEAQEQYELSLRCPTREEGDLPWVYFRLATLARSLGDEQRAAEAIAAAEAADRALPFRSGIDAELAKWRKTAQSRPAGAASLNLGSQMSSHVPLEA